MKEIKVVRRVTTTFLQAVPPQVEHFDAFIYAVVKRKQGRDIDDKWGKDVRLDPCILDWDKKIITINIPLNINAGITTENDIDPNYFEEVEAAFLALIFGCLP